jgi:hypothetical protein
LSLIYPIVILPADLLLAQGFLVYIYIFIYIFIFIFILIFVSVLFSFFILLLPHLLYMFLICLLYYFFSYLINNSSSLLTHLRCVGPPSWRWSSFPGLFHRVNIQNSNYTNFSLAKFSLFFYLANKIR